MDVKSYISKTFHDVFFNILYIRVKNEGDPSKSVTQLYFEALQMAATNSKEEEVIRPFVHQIVEKMQKDYPNLTFTDGTSAVINFIIPSDVQKHIRPAEGDIILKGYISKLLSAIAVEISNKHANDVLDARTQRGSDAVFDTIYTFVVSVQKEYHNTLRSGHMHKEHEKHHGQLQTLKYRAEIERLVRKNLKMEQAFKKMAAELSRKEKENRFLRSRLRELDTAKSSPQEKKEDREPEKEPAEKEEAPPAHPFMPQNVSDISPSVFEAEEGSEESFAGSMGG